MSYHIDLKYTKLLGGRLLNFKQKRGNVFAFSHSCEDVSKGKVKARGNIYQHDDMMMFHCYHCSVSSSFSKFLQTEDPTLYQEYRMETFKEKKGGSMSGPLFKTEKPIIPVKNTQIDSDLIPISSLSESSGPVKYLRSRCIPESSWSDLYVARDFYQFG
jgi:hypothetical protein